MSKGVIVIIIYVYKSKRLLYVMTLPVVTEYGRHSMTYTFT